MFYLLYKNNTYFINVLVVYYSYFFKNWNLYVRYYNKEQKGVLLA